jgi:hypothetical protein
MLRSFFLQHYFAVTGALTEELLVFEVPTRMINTRNYVVVVF